MAFLNSDEVQVFPSANRGSEYVTSRLTTEYNLTNIINSLVDKESFVISSDVGTDLEFNIKGYWFKVETSALTAKTEFSSASAIWAYIKINTYSSSSFDTPFVELYPTTGTDRGLDAADDEFKGIEFSSSANEHSSDSSYYKLKILVKNEDNWEIPEESKIKFTLNSPIGSEVTITIDDGDLD